MGSITGQILVGQPGMYHGGIYPTHIAWLSENSRSGWTLEPTGRGLTGGPAGEEERKEPPPWTDEATVCVPNAEHILEDGILLIAVHVLRDEGVLELVRERAPDLADIRVPFGGNPLELEKMPAKALAELRERCTQIDWNCKLVVTVLGGSSLAAQLPVLERYPMQVEVCTVAYSKLRREFAGSGPLEARGSLTTSRPGSIGELLARSRTILTELRDERKVIRTLNAPAGDYAEWLVKEATGGELAPNSKKSWDVHTPEGDDLQVKCRFVSDPPTQGQLQLSAFRSWDFDALVVVLFDDEFRVRRAVRLPVDAVENAARPDEHVNGWRVFAKNDLLDRGEDWTERLGRSRTGRDEQPPVPSGWVPVGIASGTRRYPRHKEHHSA